MEKKREEAVKPRSPALTTDQFRMYSFKVRMINNSVFAHPDHSAASNASLQHTTLFSCRSMPVPTLASPTTSTNAHTSTLARKHAAVIPACSVMKLYPAPTSENLNASVEMPALMVMASSSAGFTLPNIGPLYAKKVLPAPVLSVSLLTLLNN
jgi:hypothetical protein